MISNVINSSILIYDISDRYNIQSKDYVMSAPDWIVSAMREIGIRPALKTLIYETKFSNNRLLLPKFCENIDMVLISDRKVSYAESLYVLDKSVELNRGLNFIGDPTVNPSHSEIISGEEIGEIDPYFADDNNPMFYRIENGWLHTNVRFGKIEVKYKAIPTLLDDSIGIEFPIIPDGEHTKSAIMLYILKTLLMRGYIHPILNLKENNPLINPGIAYAAEMIEARIELNSPNRDSREKYVHPMSALFGKRRPIWIKRNEEKETVVTSTDRWINDGNSYCEVVNGFNTGYLLTPRKKQVYSFGDWVDTGETEVIRSYNDQACPLLKLAFGYCIDMTFTSPTYVAFTEGVNIGIDIPPKAGYNYLFVSIPINKTFTVADNNSLNITSEFEKVGTDNRENFVNCDLYRTTDVFYTELGFEFILNIE